jgi:hypothetical protein
MPFAYTPDMPVATHFPSADQPLMNANSQYLNDFGNQDHQFTQNSALAIDGYHKQATFAANMATPGFASGVSVLYPNTANGQSQLFFNNAAGDVQLTGIKGIVGPDAAVPSITVGPPYQAVTFLPGGMLIQFGNTTASSVTFPVAFRAGTTPSVSFSVAGTSGGAFPIVAPTASGFTTASLLAGTNLYWIAIGEE